MTYLTLSLIVFIAAGLITAFLRQVVKQASVKPVIGGKFPVEVFSEKRRWEVLWEDWKFPVGVGVGLVVGWWL